MGFSRSVSVILRLVRFSGLFSVVSGHNTPLYCGLTGENRDLFSVQSRAGLTTHKPDGLGQAFGGLHNRSSVSSHAGRFGMSLELFLSISGIETWYARCLQGGSVRCGDRGWVKENRAIVKTFVPGVVP